MTPKEIREFCYESNWIEGIFSKSGLDRHCKAMEKFLALPRITVPSLVEFVDAIEPTADLRDREGLDVTIGDHKPPPGGIQVVQQLQALLLNCQRGEYFTDGPYPIHKAYERLHPFTDGNGRSGRALWLWMMLKAEMPVSRGLFLVSWYYQSLREERS